MKNVRLQLVVTGGHLLQEQGYTVTHIRDDGFHIDYEIPLDMSDTSRAGIVASMGELQSGMAKALAELQPDYVAVLGDRYELLPICSAAFVMRIPIIHFSGGDVTEGAIDDGIRNAVTMLATYHFPGQKESYDNIVRMRGSDKNVWMVGEPGLDAFYRNELMSRKELAESLGLRLDADWALMTYHAETTKDLDYNESAVLNILKTILQQDNMQVVCTYANADFGGKRINQFLEKMAEKYPEKVITIPSLGQMRYLSLMRQVVAVLGNSSSGIVEAPFLGIPVVNVGDRQKGRYLSDNIVQSGTSEEEIREALHMAMTKEINQDDLHHWGDGHTAERVVEILGEVVACNE
jgi:UDP-hydrolysing UDP-N-acetyl-D-glucosamine 2-epimerase